MYKIIRYLSTWEIYNTKTQMTIMEHALPYNESKVLNEFFSLVHSCQSDDEVIELYEKYRKMEN
jgi:hypothetical protein